MAIVYGNIAGEESATVTFRVATVAIGRGSTTEQQEILVLGDPQSSLGLARVLAIAPTSTEYGLGVRIISGPSSAADLPVTASQGTNPWVVSGTVTPIPDTTNGWLVAMMSSADGSTALTSTAQVIKASAGKLGGWYIYNPNATAAYVSIYNVAAASVVVGTTNPQMSLCIPALSAANVEFAMGIVFSNAGWSAAATTTGGGNTAMSSPLEANFFYK